jgi:AhpD family alkylhydroperoxidase
MEGSLVTVALRRSLTQIQHVTPVRPSAAGRLVGRVYGQVERDFGMLAPPMALHSPAPTVLAASWIMLRETMLATGVVDRRTKEAVATTVSLGNTCPYCVAVHGATLHGLAGERISGVVADGRLDSIHDPGLRAAATWARAVATNDLAAGHHPRVPGDQAPELIGVVVAFQYLNRMVGIFLGDSPLPPSVPAGMRGFMTRVLGRVMRPNASRAHTPGSSLDLLPAPDSGGSGDFPWAAGNSNVESAFTRVAAAIDAAGARVAPTAVRELVVDTVRGWHGEAMGISRAWVDDAVARLPTVDRPAARLALLTALASYQVDETVIDEFRASRPDDEALIAITSWAAFVAARRVAAWIPLRVNSAS